MSSRLHANLNAALGLCCLAIAGCGGHDTAMSSPSRTDPAVQDARSQSWERKQMDRVPPEQPAAIKGEVPHEVMERIRAHLAQRTGAATDSFDVVRAESREWPNGAMGCPQPGMNYTQSLVNGYWIVLRHDGRDYDYRVAERGYMVMCEGMVLEQPPAR
jgi:hypothetical protein